MIRPMHDFNHKKHPPRLLRLVHAVWMALLLLASFGAAASSAQAQGNASILPTNLNNASDLIAAVNQVRASNGLPALKSNSALMAAAQAHSDFQAANGAASHSGSGGSTPKSRAMAAGYGGGMDVSVTENIYTGNGASAQQAVQWWQNDGPHLATMLSQSATDIGAGMATAGEAVYYTLEVGFVTSSPASGGTGATPAAGKTAAPAGGASTPAAPPPLLIGTPNPDGSIIHEVQDGQALWNIAAIYGVTVDDLIRLNKLTQNSFIRPGDKLLVREAQAESTGTITTTQSISANITVQPVTPTRRPTRSATERVQTATARAALAPTSTPAEAAALPQVEEANQPALPAAQSNMRQPAAEPGIDPVLIVIAGLVFGGAALAIVGTVLKRVG